jgi:hypothetical protein
MKPTLKLSAIAASLALTAGAASAATYDFEAEAAGPKGPVLVQLDSGVTMTITRIGGGPIEVAARTAYPPGWGGHALSPFLDVSAGAFMLTFSSAISAISVDVGDFAPSDEDVFTLTAGSGSASGSQSGSTGFPFFTTLSVTGISSFTAVLSGGSSSFPESVFWDNITVTAVPEPGTYAMLAAGLAVVGTIARRRRTT